jgi:hypothetical protein
MHRIVLDALFVLVVLQVLGRRRPKRARVPQTVELRLAQLDQPLGEILFGLPDIACGVAPVFQTPRLGGMMGPEVH